MHHLDLKSKRFDRWSTLMDELPGEGGLLDTFRRLWEEHLWTSPFSNPQISPSGRTA
jgi:hypothetical protein